MSRTKTPAVVHPDALVTHTTARIRGEQDYAVSVRHAKTTDAAVTLLWGGILMRFLSANAAQGVLEGFAAAKSALIGVDNTSPIPPRPETAEQRFARPTISIDWTRRASYAAVPHQAYSDAARRKVCWVDLHMGPITWQIFDHVGYHSAIEALRTAHRTAVGVCLDGGKHRADPLADTYVFLDRH